MYYYNRDAWNSLGDMPEEEAMAAYVDQMKLVGFPDFSHFISQNLHHALKLCFSIVFRVVADESYFCFHFKFLIFVIYYEQKTQP